MLDTPWVLSDTPASIASLFTAMSDTQWSLQDAKNRFSAVVDAALRGEPQWVSRRGKPAVVVLAATDYEKLQRLEKLQAPSFADLLLDMPQDGLPVERLPLRPREIGS